MSVLTEVYVRSSGEMAEIDIIRRTEIIQTLTSRQYGYYGMPSIDLTVEGVFDLLTGNQY